MIEPLNTLNRDIVFTHINKTGGGITSYYSLEKDLSTANGRVDYTSRGTWLKSYTDMRVEGIQRKAKKSFNALVLTISLVKRRDSLSYLIDGKELEGEIFIVEYGQHHTPFKTLKGFQKFYIDVDASLNTYRKLTSKITSKLLDPYGSINGNLVQLLDTSEGEYISKFLTRHKLEPIAEDNFVLPLEGIFKHYVGYNTSIVKQKPSEPISCLETIKNKEYINLSETCFSWKEITEREIESIEQKVDRDMLLSFKTEVDLTALGAWIDNSIKPVFDSLYKSFDTIPALDINFILHPPIITSMQFEGNPTITSPRNGINNKVVDEIEIKVPRSLIKGSQKALEVQLEVDGASFYFNSLNQPEYFKVIKGGEERSFQIEAENFVSTFESISSEVFPSSAFKFIFKIPHNVLARISSAKYYNAEVNLIDLTSERR